MIYFIMEYYAEIESTVLLQCISECYIRVSQSGDCSIRVCRSDDCSIRVY